MECAQTPSEAIRLEFQFHRKRIHFARIAFLLLANFGFDPSQLLNVMAQFVSDDVGLRKLARRAEAPVQLVEKAEVNVNLLVVRAIEGSGGGFCSAAAGLRASRKSTSLACR